MLDQYRLSSCPAVLNVICGLLKHTTTLKQVSKMPSKPAIRHIVFFSAKDKADIPRIIAGLSILSNIPHALTFEVKQNIQSDTLSDEVDIVVYAEFESTEKLAAYKADPIYAEAIKIVRPLRELRIAADIRAISVTY